MRLIDADEAIKKFGVLERAVQSDKQKKLVGWGRCIVEHCKTVDAEPVRQGHWEWRETWWEETPEAPRELFDSGWACSCCGRYLLRYLQENFHDVPGYVDCESPDTPPTVKRCPCCGAKMDGGEQDATD